MTFSKVTDYFSTVNLFWIRFCKRQALVIFMNQIKHTWIVVGSFLPSAHRSCTSQENCYLLLTKQHFHCARLVHACRDRGRPSASEDAQLPLWRGGEAGFSPHFYRVCIPRLWYTDTIVVPPFRLGLRLREQVQDSCGERARAVCWAHLCIPACAPVGPVGADPASFRLLRGANVDPKGCAPEAWSTLGEVTVFEAIIDDLW